MAQTPLFEWYGKEYASERKSSDWYWAIAIITLALVVTCVLFNNFLLALVVVAGAGAVCLQAARTSREHRFTVTEFGVAIDNDLYEYTHMRDFSVLEYIDPTLPPALSIKTNHILTPHLLIPINDHDPEEIYNYILNHIPEGAHENSLMDRIMDLLRF